MSAEIIKARSPAAENRARAAAVISTNLLAVIILLSFDALYKFTSCKNLSTVYQSGAPCRDKRLRRGRHTHKSIWRTGRTESSRGAAPVQGGRWSLDPKGGFFFVRSLSVRPSLEQNIARPSGTMIQFSAATAIMPLCALLF